MAKIEEYQREKLQEEVNFLLFWQWEYGRRASINNDLIFRAILKGERLPDQMSKENVYGWTVCSFDPPLPNIMLTLGDCRFYHSAHEIVSDLERGSFSYRLESDYASIDRELYPFGVDLSINDSWVEYLADKYGLSRGNCFNMIYDGVTAIERQQSAKAYMIPHGMGENEISYNISELRNTHLTGSHEYGELSRLARVKTQLLKTTPMARVPLNSVIKRAVGLWIWDYVQQNHCSLKRAKASFIKAYDLYKLKLENSVDEFGFYYRKTIECIEKKSVVGFSKKTRT
ncbi:hypothetical protein GM415_16060 [Pseudodesulfovibrio cashew]|uniref:Uncharacterized protein n=1 Tax=Pseudodesulfovibrio cashew TaxID=2678688 RepID=A0A6I6JHB6_9BACT|nr:hypothetical protein [Pseudodesulfovibrio cashew]QGY41571.1 hypothetical protein GM415_16060 [Pseudodesulfovibrio cashew]